MAVVRSVRFPEQLHDRLRQAAEAERRSVNAELLCLLERALGNQNRRQDRANRRDRGQIREN